MEEVEATGVEDAPCVDTVSMAAPDLTPHPPAVFSTSPDLRGGASEIGRREGSLRPLTGRNDLLASKSFLPVRGATDWQKRLAGPPSDWQK